MKGKLVLWSLQQFLQSLLHFASAGLRKRILGGDRFYLHPIFSTARGVPLPLSSARGVVHVLPSQPRATELPEPHLGSGSPSPSPPEPELCRAAPLSSGEGRRRAASSHAAPPPSLPPRRPRELLDLPPVPSRRQSWRWGAPPRREPAMAQIRSSPPSPAKVGVDPVRRQPPRSSPPRSHRGAHPSSTGATLPSSRQRGRRLGKPPRGRTRRTMAR
jgi:hypothetical protein